MTWTSSNMSSCSNCSCAIDSSCSSDVPADGLRLGVGGGGISTVSLTTLPLLAFSFDPVTEEVDDEAEIFLQSLITLPRSLELITFSLRVPALITGAELDPVAVVDFFDTAVDRA